MSRLKESKERLAVAVDQLEAMSEKAGTPGPALAAEIEALRARNTALEKANDTVSLRLDAAIDNIRGLLDS